MDSIEDRTNNILDSQKSKIIAVKSAAAGDLPNEKVNFCRKCKANGYPHEAISFRTIGDGRLKTDGSREFKTFQIVNYDNDSPHEHRQKQRGAA